MKKMKLLSKSLILIFIILISGCFLNKKYHLAHSFYTKSNYPVAIENYDIFLKKSPRSALATKAEIERSDCYYKLGLQAFAKENWILTKRLFYLANSSQADELMDNCYFEMAKIAFENNNIDSTLIIYDYIITHLTTSELIPEILYKRIKINFDLENKKHIFDDYKLLWNNYPENEFSIKSQLVINNLMPEYIDNSLTYKDTGKYEIALDLLFRMINYPTSFQDRINIEISEIYLLMANEAFTQKRFDETREYFQKTIFYNPEKETYVQDQLNNICDSFINTGNNLIEENKIDEAISIYGKAFIFIPNYPKANDAIASALDLKIKQQKSLELKNIALNYENEDDYKQALKHYKQSYSEYQTPEVKSKIFLMGNLIEAEKDPKAFAKSIILNYKNGIIPQKVNALTADLILLFGDDVKTSGWNAMYSVGKYKFEVRYDILTSEENYYFIWRVNLEDRSFVALNKISEELL